jgi:FkbM family methyltransferase
MLSLGDVMFVSVAKRLAVCLPLRSQQELKRRYFRRQIRAGTFRTDEPEWQAASLWLQPGDWAIDVGANVGHYTCRFSHLVGPQGRVIAFEPVPDTFELLSANTVHFSHANVTLLNLAASNGSQLFGLNIPQFEMGLTNYYRANLTKSNAGTQVMSCAIDSLALSGRVRLLKVDAEGHDSLVIGGAEALLERDRPTIIIESDSPEVSDRLVKLGYARQRLPGSPNTVYTA